jgi:DNA/RNA endonuclease G (NUC1)
MNKIVNKFRLMLGLGAVAVGVLTYTGNAQAYDLSYHVAKEMAHLVSSSSNQPAPQGLTVPLARAATVGQGGAASGLCPEHYPLGAPVVVSADHDRVERRSFYLCRIGYSVQFDPATKTPLWSAENLNGQQINGAREPRTNDFQPDPQVPGPAQATLKDYVHTKFDRGHMSPAADQSGRPGDAMSQSFYLTNMVPQVGPNQNRGIWADLEAQVRHWSEQRGDVAVVTGPIFDPRGHATMGSSNVWVPVALYKVVIDPQTMSAIAFIIPNRQIVTRKTHTLDEGNPEFPQTTPAQAINCGNVCTVASFAVPVSQVEQATGLRFFSRLDNATHQRVVQAIDNSWRFGR